MPQYTLFIFRRDLRIKDNNGLNFAMKNYDNILPIFIFTPEQITSKNKYKSDNAIFFMLQSLKELDKELRKYKSKLHLFYGDNIAILNKIRKKIDIENIVFNIDYTPYSKKRDRNIVKFCKKYDINCKYIEDYLLAPMGTFNKKNGDPYTIFSPFRDNGMKHKIDKPSNVKIRGLILKGGLGESGYIKIKKTNIPINGGRKSGLKLLGEIKKQKKYNKMRNILTYETTRLSAHIKFGCLSIREVYWKIKANLGVKNALISQLFWREFYYYIVFYFPDVLRGQNFSKKFTKIKWNGSKTNYKLWSEGKTGYPIIDAGMRELNYTGYMHNRARLITANFLNRILGIDWRWGEKYYSHKLTDYDPSVNNGNWQWVASTGVDTKPFTQRIFNPILQSKKYDADAKYIKKWLPNLKNIPANELHNWQKYYEKYDLKKLGYYKPIVNYEIGREKSIKMYKQGI